jgi:2,3-bisphosphoglycerate-independent phosphoglycerate mutase
MNFLFIFIDGIGLGPDNPEINPFARASMPVISSLIDGSKLTIEHAPVETKIATLLPIDACLKVDGLPQSATGQAVLMTGRNIPAEIGIHYGPKPNREITNVIENGNLFKLLRKSGKNISFLNAYPPSYFNAVTSKRRLHGTIPLSVVSAGIPLKTQEDLINGKAVSADFTGSGWINHLGIENIPILTNEEAGNRIANLASEFDFTLFEYWLSDYAGHGCDMEVAVKLLEDFDTVIGGILENWSIKNSLILITSDHGNMEDLSTRKHTRNPVPALIIGSSQFRSEFITGIKDLTDIAPAILNILS